MEAFMKWFMNPNKNPLARIHRDTIARRLKQYGLRYDDLYDPYYDLDIKEALSRLPREIVDARHQRLKRAIDLSMKHVYLPVDLQVQQHSFVILETQYAFNSEQTKQTPFRSYLQPMLALVKKERAEREALGALPFYQRTFP